jgi:hypothetical protein
MKGKKIISPKQLKRLRRQIRQRATSRYIGIGGKNTLATAHGVNSKNLKKVIQQAKTQKKKSWVDRTAKRTSTFQKSISTATKRKNPTNVRRLRKISNYLKRRDNRSSQNIKQSPIKLQKKQARKPILKGYQARQQFVKMQESRKAKIAKKTSSKVVRKPKSKSIKSLMNQGAKRFISRARPQSTLLKVTQKIPSQKGVNKFKQMSNSKMKVSPKINPVKKRIITKGR